MIEKKRKALFHTSFVFPDRFRSGWILGMAALMCIGCGDGGPISGSGLKELKEGQKKIMERLEALEKSQKDMLTASKNTARRRPQIDYNKVYQIPTGDSPVRGDADAKVTLVEFSDYQCPFSKRAQPLIHQLMDAFPHDLKHVFKNFPLRFHKRAEPAARACIAAGKQGKFWEMEDLIFENQRKLEDADLKSYAEKLGLDIDRFEKDLQSKEVTKEIQDDVNLARKVNVTGTPTLFLNGKRVRQRDFEAMKAEIEKLKGGNKG